MQRLRGDDGAVAVLVALLLPVVLLGFGALVLDFGALYAEKRQLQNGADAGALAAAREYAAAGPAGCVVGAKTALADTYNDQNANDPAGSNIVGTGCPAPNKVRVTTSSNSADGAFIAPFLAQVLGAGPTTLEAVASAAWGPPSGLTSSLPLTISVCEFNFYTAAATNLAPSPPYPPYPTGFEKIIQFHGQDGPSPCPVSNSGADLPGGFGWLNTGESCAATTNAGGWVNDSTGVPPPNSCSANYMRSLLGRTINIPVFDATNGLTGANGRYRIMGYAAFVLTGYNFTGQYREKSIATTPNSHLCSGAERCIYGFFTKPLAPTTGTVGTGPNLGVTVVQLTD